MQTQIMNAARAALGRAGFNELWATSGTSNGMGKCVSAAAKARRPAAPCTPSSGSASAAATDRVAATKTEAQERKRKR